MTTRSSPTRPINLSRATKGAAAKTCTVRQVLSLLAGYHPDHFIGVAPDAEYILAKTELNDDMPEMPTEEDRWVAGLEWADSLGAQVVNSSLGYNRWDDGTGYSPADLDGETALTSVAAALARAARHCGGGGRGQ